MCYCNEKPQQLYGFKHNGCTLNTEDCKAKYFTCTYTDIYKLVCPNLNVWDCMSSYLLLGSGPLNNIIYF